ncbi:hypothetical protein D3C77_679010 [compost metagenome]
MLGEIALDDTRQQHADHSNTGAGHDTADENTSGTKSATHGNARSQGQEDAENDSLTAKTPSQYWRQRCEQPQAKHWQGR